MRGIRVGVGDVDEVPGGTRYTGHQTGGDYDWREGRECHAGLVDGHERPEHAATAEPNGNGIELNDGAWLKHGACELHSESSGEPHGVRVDRVGVGDLGEVSGGTGRTWYQKSDDDGREKDREPDTSMVGKCRCYERCF